MARRRRTQLISKNQKARVNGLGPGLTDRRVSERTRRFARYYTLRHDPLPAIPSVRARQH